MHAIHTLPLDAPPHARICGRSECAGSRAPCCSYVKTYIVRPSKKRAAKTAESGEGQAVDAASTGGGDDESDDESSDDEDDESYDEDAAREERSKSKRKRQRTELDEGGSDDDGSDSDDSDESDDSDDSDAGDSRDAGEAAAAEQDGSDVEMDDESDVDLDDGAPMASPPPSSANEKKVRGTHVDRMRHLSIYRLSLHRVFSHWVDCH